MPAASPCARRPGRRRRAAAVGALRARGVEFVEREILHPGRPGRAHPASTSAGSRSNWSIARRSLDDDHAFGMDTITLAGPLEAKLARDPRRRLHPGDAQCRRHRRPSREGWRRRCGGRKESGLRVTGFQVLRDFEGLDGHLHAYKVDVARAMLKMCAELGSGGAARLLVDVGARHRRPRRLARDLRKLAMLAVPFGIRVAYEGLSWGRHVNEFTAAWEVVWRADRPNLGLGLDSFHILARRPRSSAIERHRSARRSSWCSSRTSCGRRRAPSKNAWPRRGRSASSPAKACTASRSVTLVLALDD